MIGEVLFMLGAVAAIAVIINLILTVVEDLYEDEGFPRPKD